MGAAERGMRATRRERGREGFTLLEVLIAMSILAVGMLSLAAMQLHALRGGAQSRHTTAAAIVARDQLEQFETAPWGTLAPTAGFVAGAPVVTQVQEGAGNLVDETYNVQWQIQDLVANWTRAIDVIVTWNEPQRPNQQLVLSTVRYHWEP